MKSRLLIALLLWITPVSYTLAAEGNDLKTEFIPLYNILPDEIIPLIRPFLADEDVLIGTGSQLIIKTSPKRLDEALAIIKRFDQPPQKLLITVIQGRDLSAESLSFGARVRANIDLSGSSRTNLMAQGHIRQATTRRDNEERQSIQTMDGKEAFIQFGTKQPLPEYQLYDQGGRIGISSGIRYHDVTRGFYVRPKLVGNQVRVEISPWSNKMSRLGGGVIDTSQAKTTLNVRLGEWAELGGVNETANEQQQGLLSRHRSTKKAGMKIFIKVESLD